MDEPRNVLFGPRFRRWISEAAGAPEFIDGLAEDAGLLDDPDPLPGASPDPDDDYEDQSRCRRPRLDAVDSDGYPGARQRRGSAAGALRLRVVGVYALAAGPQYVARPHPRVHCRQAVVIRPAFYIHRLVRALPARARPAGSGTFLSQRFG